MNKVWLVIEDDMDTGKRTIAVFDTCEAAKKFTDKLTANRSIISPTYYFEEWDVREA